MLCNYGPEACFPLSQGIELGARAMVAAGAQDLFVSLPSPISEFQVERDASGHVINQAELEDWIQGVHRQGMVAF